MSRSVFILLVIGFIIGAIAVTMGAAYAVADWAGGDAGVRLWGSSWMSGRLTNIIFLMLGFVMIIATLLTVAERKWSAMIQDRIGPNRARINLPLLRNRSLGGLPHLAADTVKMLFKEDFVPKHANPILFNLGPILAFAPAFALFAIVPAGPTIVTATGKVSMVVATPDFGLLYIFAIASLAVYGTSLAGWSSNNKLALLGGVRASSQMISYEVALGLSLVGVMIAFSTVRLPDMVEAQAAYLWQPAPTVDFGLPLWGFFLQPVGLILFFAAAFAETKRAPFDLPEGESEIIGYFVEYSGMKFGLFMISEFVEIVVLSGVTTAVFFGGYHLPFGEAWLSSRPLFLNYPILWGALGATVFWIKVLILCWFQLTIRWTFPRFRYDQIQRLGWKMLLPIGLANVFLSGALILWDPTLKVLGWVGVAEISMILALTMTAKHLEEDVVPIAAPASEAH